jgi:quercetin dioxygenase-like cupin family protein
VRIESSQPYTFREHRFRFLVDSDDTGGSYSAMHIDSPHGTGPRPHVHEEAEEAFFLLRGRVTFHVADQEFQASAGEFVHVPRGTLHHFVVDSDEATYLAFYAPGGEERGFREVGVPEE